MSTGKYTRTERVTATRIYDLMGRIKCYERRIVQMGQEIEGLKKDLNGKYGGWHEAKVTEMC